MCKEIFVLVIIIQFILSVSSVNALIVIFDWVCNCRSLREIVQGYHRILFDYLVLYNC